ncbi:response regulator [Pedosphaera parvula]|uniref:Response regulator receiver protein n=1 Tax=Pedosphaera parvula (strain Ellin514) TaxID=320771 RepID=B9XBP4_PEDPL|nr:response regulator [Pedosphaera parvula]EEF62929.1 response regulator receiver protein [Pedosphaera parvula Ellin514]
MSDLILIVEDDENDVLLVKQTFIQAHLINPVIALQSSEEAMTYLEGKPPYANRVRYPLPSILFLDLKLIGKDGLSLLTWLRETRLIERMMVVVLSGYHEMNLVNTAYHLGAKSFLTKPVHVKDLTNLMLAYPQGWIRG